MFKSLIVKIAKKYILGSLNDFLYRNKDNAKKVSEQIGIWSSRLQAILIDLDKVAKFAEDGKLDDDEAKKTLEMIDQLIKDFK